MAPIEPAALDRRNRVSRRDIPCGKMRTYAFSPSGVLLEIDPFARDFPDFIRGLEGGGSGKRMGPAAGARRAGLFSDRNGGRL